MVNTHNADVLHEALKQANIIIRMVDGIETIFAVLEYRAKHEELFFKPALELHDDNKTIENLNRLCDDETLRVFKVVQLATK